MDAAHPTLSHTDPHFILTLQAEATQTEALLLRQVAEEAAQRSAGEAAAARQTAAQLDGALKAKERDVERGAKVRRWWRGEEQGRRMGLDPLCNSPFHCRSPKLSAPLSMGCSSRLSSV